MKRSLIARSGLGSLLALAVCFSLPSRAGAQAAPVTPAAPTSTATKDAAKDSAVQLSVFTSYIDPKTGEEIPISARRVVTFHASQKLKSQIDGADRG